MIMPANYSAIAENELSYVDGGWVDIMNVKTLETNIAKAIGNAYAQDVMAAFIGSWFDGGDKDKSIFGYVGGKIGDLFTKNMGTASPNSTAGKVLRGIINTIGVLGGVWVLGSYDMVKTGEVTLTGASSPALGSDKKPYHVVLDK